MNLRDVKNGQTCETNEEQILWTVKRKREKGQTFEATRCVFLVYKSRAFALIFGSELLLFPFQRDGIIEEGRSSRESDLHVTPSLHALSKSSYFQIPANSKICHYSLETQVFQKMDFFRTWLSIWYEIAKICLSHSTGRTRTPIKASGRETEMSFFCRASVAKYGKMVEIKL